LGTAGAIDWESTAVFKLRSSFIQHTFSLGLVGSLLAGLTGLPARANNPVLSGTLFPGYTRPGYPASDETTEGKIIFAAAAGRSPQPSEPAQR